MGEWCFDCGGCNMFYKCILMKKIFVSHMFLQHTANAIIKAVPLPIMFMPLWSMLGCSNRVQLESDLTCVVATKVWQRFDNNKNKDTHLSMIMSVPLYTVLMALWSGLDCSNRVQSGLVSVMVEVIRIQLVGAEKSFFFSEKRVKICWWVRVKMG